MKERKHNTSSLFTVNEIAITCDGLFCKLSSMMRHSLVEKNQYLAHLVVRLRGQTQTRSTQHYAMKEMQVLENQMNRIVTIIVGISWPNFALLLISVVHFLGIWVILPSRHLVSTYETMDIVAFFPLKTKNKYLLWINRLLNQFFIVWACGISKAIFSFLWKDKESPKNWVEKCSHVCFRLFKSFKKLEVSLYCALRMTYTATVNMPVRPLVSTLINSPLTRNREYWVFVY